MSSLPCIGLTLGQWQQAYRSGLFQPHTVLQACRQHLSDNDNAWISLASQSQLDSQLDALQQRLQAVDGNLEALPLYGIPFAIKDNIDAQGWTTTAGCPEFAYLATDNATVVERLQAAGAILLGKTNLDQFATGLVGTRSPYGAVDNSFDPRYVSGGSSSGSASVVARGLVPFALGTDTAGSGRVPAGFNNIVGLKPSKGWLPNSGLVPACRTLDCISIFALTAGDAARVAELAGGYDERDPYSRRNPNCAPAGLPPQPRIGIPEPLEFYGDHQAEQAFQAACQQMRQLGAELVSLDFSAFSRLATDLYQGPWVAERTAAVGEFLQHNAPGIDAVVAGIIDKGHQYSAVEVFQAEYRRAALSREIHQQLATVDALMVPTSPTLHTQAEMAEEPVLFNSHFGYYTNFTNLADLSALALPAPFREDHLPAGITLLAPAWHDLALARFGQRWQAHLDLPLGATGKAYQDSALPVGGGHVRVAVVGAHLSGMPLNFQLTQRDAMWVEQTLTAAEYRLFALAASTPPKPGLLRDPGQGQSIIVELWDIPLARFGEFVAEIPAPLGIGNLLLADGRWVKGFICEAWALQQAEDISHFGGWRAFINRSA